MFDFSRFLTGVKQGEPALLAKSGAGTIARLAASAVRAGKRAVVVARDTDEAFRLKALLGVFLPDSAPGSGTGRIVSFLPSFSPGKRTSEDWSERLGSARSFVCGVSKVLILTCDNLLFKYPGTFFFYKHEFFVHKNEELSQEVFIRQLAEWGYRRASVTAHAGEFSRRGDIVDVLPSGMEKPVRLEFFGDVVDEMRIFDPSSQRSTEDIGSVCITPAMPFLGTSGSQKEIRNRTGGLFQRGDISEFGQAALLRAAEQSDPLLMPGMVSSEADFLEKLVPEDTVWFASGLSGISEALLGHETIWRDALEKDGAERRLEQPFYLVMRDSERAARDLKGQRCISAEPLLMGVESKGMELAERTYHIFSDVFGTAGITERPWQQMVLGIRKMLAEKRQVILAFSGERGRSKYLKLAERDGLYPAMRYDERSRGLFAVVAPCRGGVELVWDDCIVLGEDLLQPRGSEGGTAAKSAAFKGLNSSEGLEAGDFLVHRDYGVGRFGGLRRMAVGGVENDYLLIEYADGAKLYLPVDRLTLVQRFKTSDGSVPALDKLGGAAWKAGKEKARKAVEKIAADLVEMYAWRKIAKGFTYSPLGEMYNEFEASFGFEETPDQAKAIRDVLDDMEKPVPMDRLVCGDVGFGKTEVALRAAFRAACDGRQSALLCPTTVLAEQHYQTFRARLAGFPVNVGLLSRFVSKKQQTEILKAAEKGQIDILIGTHRILSGDVRLPNLSLLILDEEQRFGVRHKEKMKELKRNVDVLTLSATPIPRTLQLSMSGIRDLSIIETAPPERKPVASMILNRDPGPLKQIVERELERGGQVFWVRNRVEGLEQVASFVKTLVPNARVAMAHGRMSEKELESSMHRFWHGEIDVLVATAIIESGLDFPNANTLIVDQAQLFGLGQLYQLRGRVGRSDKQAYAVFVVSDIERMQPAVRERLRVITELDYLGAGFRVAMEDLRVRGAGNILGEAQSGHIGRIGLDLFLEMLEEAVEKQKGEGRTKAETELSINIPANIPENFIDDGKERLKYYKSLSSSVTEEDRDAVVMEMRDRFGQIPQELENLVAVLSFKAFCGGMGIERADIRADSVKVTFAEGQNAVEPEKAIRLVMQGGGNIRLLPPSSLQIMFESSQSIAANLGRLRDLLGKLKS